MSQDQKNKQKQIEPEHRGSIWKHPVMLYAVLNGLIFGGMVLIGWLAWTNGWIPSRG